MLYAFIGYPPVTGRTMMNLEAVARSVLIAHPALVAVDGKPGLALGRPFGRPHVTFIVAASHWSSMLMGLPYLSQEHLTPPSHIAAQQTTAHQNLPGPTTAYRATPHSPSALAGGMPYHNQPNRTSPKLNAPDPTEENTTQPKRTLAYLSAGYLSIPRLTWPHRILTHTHCALAGVFPSKPGRTPPIRTVTDPAATHRYTPKSQRSHTNQTAPRHSVSDRKRKTPNTCAARDLLKVRGQ